MRRSLRSGFTLIEILIVVGIIGVLVVVLLAVLLTASARGEVAQAEYFVNNAIPEAMLKWQNENGKDSNTYPASPNLADGDGYTAGNISLFEELITKPAKKQGAYMTPDLYTERKEGGKSLFLDPWNNPYIYRNYTQKKSASGSNRTATIKRRYNENSYDIISLGPDATLYELDGENDDIYNGVKP